MRLCIYQFLPAQSAIKEASLEARVELDRSEILRAYENPKSLINALESNTHRLAATIQHEGGARISEAAYIKEHQLQGIKEGQGRIKLDFTKGGKERQLSVSPETFRQLECHIHQHGELNVDKNVYRQDLRIAAVITGQSYSGSHGLRWSYAQERMDYLQVNGYTHEQSLTIVSHEMGHSRADITNHYLRK